MAQEYRFMHLGAGLACDPSGIAAGYAAGYVGYAVRLRLFPFAAVTDKPPHLNIVRPCIRLRIKSIRGYGPHPHLFRSARTSISVLLWFPLTYSPPDMPQAHRSSLQGPAPQAYDCLPWVLPFFTNDVRR